MHMIQRAAPSRRKFLWLLVVLGIVAGAPWAFTQAIFTDTQDVPGNAFTTGTVDIATSPASAFLTSSAMAPGDSVTAPLTISNSGTLQLRYAMSTLISDSAVLAAGMELEIKSGVTTCTTAGFGATGTTLYTGSLTGGAIGSSAQGPDAGDRTLNAGANEVLCFQARLPITADNSMQGSSTTATFTFSAEQTANNP